MSDRTTDLLQRAQPYRQSLQLKYKDRFIAPSEVASKEKAYMTEAVQLHFALVQSAQKLEALRATMKENSLFNNQHERIKTLADAVDAELRNTQERLEGIDDAGTDDIRTVVKEVLQGRLFSLTRDFKQVLQVRTKSLRAAEEKKREFSSARSYQSTAVRSEPSFMEDS